MTTPTRDMSYADYLALDDLLAAQRPLSNEHDELLFIVIHQASELWLKLSIHELAAARDHIARDDLGPAFKMIARVSRIQGQLIQSWDVLATMTPSDYARLRPHLGSSSGFQSHQFRHLEFLMGGRDAAHILPHRGRPAEAALSAALGAPSLYDECIRLLARRGFAIPAALIERDWSRRHVRDPAVAAAWLSVYRDPERFWDLYELAEKLMDLEFRFQQWRFAHMKTVERIIGFQTGTGGSAGSAYLARALSESFFPELLEVRGGL
ncbi:MAG TPA: tryptophan 2,3-dioxygenase family protein [Caulobacteraceae bacterium]|jgi:tryptophan 2,3-dioxygenase|nr:tryptophan 2,3-dioxygenase family protein [Caulobacteraceae bacterium]